jgi:hypothetical protein
MKKKLTLKIIATMTTPITIAAWWHMLAPESACWLTATQMAGCFVTMLVGCSLLFIVYTAPKDLFDDNEEE